jgi:hypothetical protein
MADQKGNLQFPPIHSGIKLELHIYSKISNFKTNLTDEESKENSNKDDSLAINYKMLYGGLETIWKENCATILHKS